MSFNRKLALFAMGVSLGAIIFSLLALVGPADAATNKKKPEYSARELTKILDCRKPTVQVTYEADKYYNYQALECTAKNGVELYAENFTSNRRMGIGLAAWEDAAYMYDMYWWIAVCDQFMVYDVNGWNDRWVKKFVRQNKQYKCKVRKLDGNILNRQSA